VKTAHLLTASAIALTAALAACSSSSTKTDDTTTDGDSLGDGSQFLAFASNFAGYHGWEKLVVDAPTNTDLDAGPHFNGPRTVYVKRGGPAGAATFAKGTLIVKEVNATTGEPHTFAMAKRGASYNGTGAVGWEYFELEPASTGTDEVTVKWRGVGPPDGENYGGAADGGCNGCHAAAASTDYVLVPGLKP
jgi:hypothetical protein